MRRFAAKTLALALVVSACGKKDGEGSTTASSSSGSSSSGGESRLEYGEEARAAYERALLQFRRGNCMEAIPAFQRIRSQYPYSRFAALAELRTGDCQFKEKGYAEAIETYRTFARHRPSHSQLPYARFRTAEARFKQIPRDWLLAPPSHERDQTAARDALRELRRFVQDHPNDDRVSEANRMIRETLGLLARHELYAARFYRRLRAREGAARRLEVLLANYEGSGYEAEALLMLAELRKDLGRMDDARAALIELIERFPESEEAADARRKLGPSAPPPRAPAQTASPSPAPAPEPPAAPSAPESPAGDPPSTERDARTSEAPAGEEAAQSGEQSPSAQARRAR